MHTYTRHPLLTAAFALSVALCGLSAAEDAPPVPPPPPVTPDNGPDKAISTASLDVDYVFDDLGRRDPFTFTKNVVVPQDQVIANGPDNIEKTDRIPPEMVEKKKNAAELACNLAEGALMELDPNTAIAKTEQGMEEFKDIPNMSFYPELEVVKGRLLRARKASENLRGRQAAQRDFDAMNIKIMGVVAMPKNSKVIVNTGKDAEILHKGSLVKMSSDAADVMVDEILPERVVFNFRGYRMMLLLQDAVGK